MGTRAKKIKKPVKTRMGTYEVLFESNTPQKGYTVTIPKLRGIVTFGDTLAEAKMSAIDAIELHCECLLEEGLAQVRVVSSSERQILAKR